MKPMSRSEEEEFVLDRISWPQWPILPLRSRAPLSIMDKDCLAFLLDDDPLEKILSKEDRVPFRVYVGNLYLAVFGGSKELVKMPTKNYQNIADLLTEWMVD